MAPPVRLRIASIIEYGGELADRVDKELPSHQGLQQAARQAVEAAATAERTAARLRRPLSLHRLPVIFLVVALLTLVGFAYRSFFHTTTLSLALPDRDAAAVRARVDQDSRLQMHIVEVPGSREAVEALNRGAVDLGFVQGGVPFPRNLPRLELPARELVLLFVREGRPLSEVKQVLTSVPNEGSHSVAALFFAAWGKEVRFVHAWKDLTASADYQVPADVDAVFVVKDPADEKTLLGAARLAKAGFVLVSAPLGARAQPLDYLDPITVPVGHLQLDPPVPATAVSTYSVSTYLVARDGLTPRVLSQAAAVIEPRAPTIADGSFHLTSLEASELLQGVDAFLSILVNIGFAFLGLLGLDVVTYRRHLHELNSLVSLVSLLQSNKDVLGLTDPAKRAEHQLYLGLCSDLLGVISAISSFYTQENSSLLFNNLSEVVHHRCDALKLNIQLKLLHSLIRE